MAELCGCYYGGSFLGLKLCDRHAESHVAALEAQVREAVEGLETCQRVMAQMVRQRGQPIDDRPAIVLDKITTILTFVRGRTG